MWWAVDIYSKEEEEEDAVTMVDAGVWACDVISLSVNTFRLVGKVL